MRVCLEEIESKLAAALSEPLWQRWRQNIAALHGVAWRMAVGLLLLGMLLVPLQVDPRTILLGALGVPVAFAVYWGSIAMRARPTALRPLSAAELRRASASLPLNPSEQRYLDTLYELLSAAPALGQQPARDLLPQLNELLQNDRHLELQRERARAAMGSRTPAELEAERADLARRTEAVTDPLARRAMQQSLELCEERLRGLYALEPQLTRIDAQRELISQTFASVQSALAGVQATSGAPGVTSVERLGRTVLQINQQTRALEEAVQEVIALPPA